MSFKVIMWIVLVALAVLEKYASSRASWAWGGIIPAVVIISSVVTIIMYDIALNYSNIMPFALYLVIILSIWIKGRSAYQKRQQKELDKMSALDIR